MRHENLKLFALVFVPKYLLLTRGTPVSVAQNLVPSWSVQVVNRDFIIKQKMHYVTEVIARPEGRKQKILQPEANKTLGVLAN